MQKDTKKIVIVFVTLIFLLLGILYLRNRNRSRLTELSKPAEIQEQTEKPAESRGQKQNIVFLETGKGDLKAGGEAQVNVNFRTDNPDIFGADAVILYDTAYVATSGDRILPGNFFKEFPRISVDEENGIIRVTAYGADKTAPLNEPVNFLKINFLLLKAGPTEVNLDFTQGTTNTSTLVEKENSINILDAVENLKFNITP